MLSIDDLVKLITRAYIAELSQCNRMFEVKGPGNRLQDNQLRWMVSVLQGLPPQFAHVRTLVGAAECFCKLRLQLSTLSLALASMSHPLQVRPNLGHIKIDQAIRNP